MIEIGEIRPPGISRGCEGGVPLTRGKENPPTTTPHRIPLKTGTYPTLSYPGRGLPSLSRSPGVTLT